MFSLLRRRGGAWTRSRKTAARDVVAAARRPSGAPYRSPEVARPRKNELCGHNRWGLYSSVDVVAPLAAGPRAKEASFAERWAIFLLGLAYLWPQPRMRHEQLRLVSLLH